MNMTQNLSMSRALMAAMLALGGLVGTSSLSAQSVVTNPVGAISQQVAAGVGAGSYTFLGFPLVAASVWQGPASAVSATQITVSGSPLVSGAYSLAPHYVVVTSGANVGLTVDIVSNTANTITLAEDVTGLISGSDSFTVRPHATLASLFGAANSAGFGGGASLAAADEIRIFNPTTQNFVTYYYKSSGIGGTGWRSSSSTSADRSKDIVYPEQSIVVFRKVASPLTLVAVGDVNAAQVKIPVEPGFTWICNPAPVSTTLGAFGFYTGTASGLTGSSSLSAADEVWRWTGTAWEIFYYKTSGIGGTGWRTTASTSLDRSSQAIQPGEPLLVRRKSTSLLVTKPGFVVSL